MRGFVVGSLALVVLYVIVQPNAARAVEGGGNVLVAGMRRLLSPDVAGIPQRRAVEGAGKKLGKIVGGGIRDVTGGPYLQNLGG